MASPGNVQPTADSHTLQNGSTFGQAGGLPAVPELQAGPTSPGAPSPAGRSNLPPIPGHGPTAGALGRQPGKLPPMGTPPLPAVANVDTMPSNGSDTPAHSSIPMRPLPPSSLAPIPPRNKLPPIQNAAAVSPALASALVPPAPGAIASPGADGRLAPPANAGPQEQEILATYAAALER